MAAVVEGDAHAAAVSRWLDEFILGQNFCPWAKPAQERSGIRLITSTAMRPEQVLEDLLSEAELLPMNSEGAEGEATTTLLICPHVEDWSEYEPFSRFFAEELDDGAALQDELGIKVDAFHPKYSRFGFSVGVGDRIAVSESDETMVFGTVLDEEAGIHPDDGEELIDVRFDDGQEFLVRYSEITAKIRMQEDGTEQPGDDASADAANLVSRAPRPLLHLLRVEDLDRAGMASQAGAGPKIEAVLEGNSVRAAKIGLKGMDDLLERCC